MIRLIIFLLFAPFVCSAQLTKTDSLWLPFKSFIGTWKGTGEGVDGKGTYERSYHFILNKKYIEVKNKSVYPATKEKPKGYVHEDVGYISYDKMRNTFVFRQFHIEGFVNQYKLESISHDGKTIVFVSEAIENIPQGWRAKETYTINSEKELTEAFDLAEPDNGFASYTKAILRKTE